MHEREPSPSLDANIVVSPLNRFRPHVLATPPLDDSTTARSSTEPSPPALTKHGSCGSWGSETVQMHLYLQRRTTEVWQKRIVVACWAHQQLCNEYAHHARIFNVLSVTLNAVVGSAIFSSLGDSSQAFWLRFIAGAVSILVAVISSVKTELNFDGLREQHRLAHRGYDRVKQRVEQLRQVRFIDPVDNETGQLNNEWELVLEEANQLSTDAPTVPERVRAELERRYEAGLDAERRHMEAYLPPARDAPTARGRTAMVTAAMGGNGAESGGCGNRSSSTSRARHLVAPGPKTGGKTPEPSQPPHACRRLFFSSGSGQRLLIGATNPLHEGVSGSYWLEGSANAYRELADPPEQMSKLHEPRRATGENIERSKQVTTYTL